MNGDLGRRLLAEFVGTALLVIFGAGALVAALEMGQGKLDYAGLGIVAISFALVIAAVIYMFGSTSGAHINPAVTFSLAVVRRFPWVEVIPYRPRAARRGARRGDPHQRDLRVAGERPERVRRHDRRGRIHEGASHARGGARHVPAPGDDHGARGRSACSGGLRRPRDRARGGVRDHGHRADQRRLGEPCPHLRPVPRHRDLRRIGPVEPALDLRAPAR